MLVHHHLRACARIARHPAFPFFHLKTSETADLDPLIRPGDTLLCEVSFGPGPVPVTALHLDGPLVGDLAARTGVARVLLTHLQMGFDRDETVASVRARFDGPVDLVDPGDRITI